MTKEQMAWLIEQSGGRDLVVYEDEQGRKMVAPRVGAEQRMVNNLFGGTGMVDWNVGTGDPDYNEAIPLEDFIGTPIKDPTGVFGGSVGFGKVAINSNGELYSDSTGLQRPAAVANPTLSAEGVDQSSLAAVNPRQFTAAIDPSKVTVDPAMGILNSMGNTKQSPLGDDGLGGLVFGALLSGLGALGPLSGALGGGTAGGVGAGNSLGGAFDALLGVEAGGGLGAGLGAAGGAGIGAGNSLGAGVDALLGLDAGGGLGATAGAAGAVGDPFIDAFTATGTGGGATGLGTGTAGAGAAASAGQSALSKLLKDTFGIDVSSGTLDLIGKALGTVLGIYGANKQADASSDLYRQFMDLGAPYRASLASLEANPAGYYQSPEVQGALQQGSDALARSLSAKVGNPILNPTALQEMQNYTTNGLLGQLNQRRNFLAAAGGLGVPQSAQLGMQSVGAKSGVYDAIGSGIGSVFGNQRDYASELLDILRQQRSGSSGLSLA